MSKADKRKRSASASPSRKRAKPAWRIHLHRGDLFQAEHGNKVALAHCVSRDLHMGKGIATLFKQKFGRVRDLKAQGKGVGQVAVLDDETTVVYYLITKEKYYGKPTYDTLRASLEECCRDAQARGIERLNIPRLGCGLDRLKWPRVLQILTEVFRNVLQIHVYAL